MVGGASQEDMVHHRLPKRIMSGELEKAGQHGLGGKVKEWTGYVADDRRVFGNTVNWSTTALFLDPGVW